MNSQEKIRYRKWAKELRSSLDIQKISLDIVKKIRHLDLYKTSSTVMSYLAKDIEISLSDLFQDKTKSWFLPVVRNDTANRRDGETARQMVVVRYMPGETKLQKGKFNILEPGIINDNYFDQIENKIKLDVIFVPGLCFDKEGNRIGFGAGFYDNFLRLNSSSFKIGVCPKECLVEKLPVDSWDIKLDLVVTD